MLRITWLAAGFAALIAVLQMAATTHAQTPAKPGERYPRLYPTSTQNFGVAELQLSLFKNRCYGNQFKLNQVDGKIGPLTRKAIDVFVDEYLRKFPNTRFATPQDVAEKTGQQTTLCENSPFRQQYFPSAQEHVEWIQVHQKLYPVGEDPIWEMKTVLLLNGCYGEITDTTTHDIKTDFGSYSRRALHVFVDTYHDRNKTKPQLATSKDVIAAAKSTATADNLRGRLSSFCKELKFLAVYFPGAGIGSGSAGKCAFPDSGKAWLSSLGSVDGSFSQPSRLSTAVRDLEEAYQNFDAQVTLLHEDKNAAWLGKAAQQKMLEARGSLLLGIEMVLEHQEMLSKYGAILSSKDRLCEKCVLLADWDLLTSIASLPQRGGERFLRGTKIGTKTALPPIDVAELTFDDLKKAHVLIEAWSRRVADFEKAKQELLSPDPAADKTDAMKKFAEATLATEKAKQEMLNFLSGEVEARKDARSKAEAEARDKGTPPLPIIQMDRPYFFVRQRTAFCGPDVRVPGFRAENE